MLASGSKGNCVIIEGRAGSLLIDAGLSAKECLVRMGREGIDADNIEAILVTHEHTDHIRGVDVLARKLEIPVYGTEGTLADFLHFRRTSAKPIVHHTCRDRESFTIGDFRIDPFNISHDAKEPCGFIISEGDIRMGYCTDTGIITPHMHDLLCHCDGIVLESNH
jgi:phosphoribosyl 1,2-cyclic phosphodiesterase